MSQIKNTIKKTLLEERKRKLKESFYALNDIKDPDFAFHTIVKVYGELLEEGYHENEINSMILEFELGDVTKELDNTDWKKVMGDAAISGLKEYAINFVLSSVLGVKREVSAQIAVVLADVNPITLLRVFKSLEDCKKDGVQLIDAVLEALGRYLGAEWFAGGQSRRTDYSLMPLTGIASSYGGNMLGEVIRETNLGEKITEKFCGFVH